MAIMTDDGKLKTLQTVDLMNALSTLDEHDRIDMWDMFYCLGARAATLALSPDAPLVTFYVYSGTVKGKDEQYTFWATDAVGTFIMRMIDMQESGDEETKTGLLVRDLRLELDAYTDKLINVLGWEDAL